MTNTDATPVLRGPNLLPTPQQLAWQEAGLGMFFHFGVNTFARKEWSDGTLPVESFNPTDLDTDQWVRTAKAFGAKYVVLTAKHHDGFCLWPTKTTKYGVTSSPWKDGQGDVVAELRASCDKYGMDLGLYLSPWDRNAECYEDAEAYDDFFTAQLEEICTQYGELVEVWFDGAGSVGRVYDWDRYMAVVHKHQPKAMIFNMGAPTIRWVGNEDGLAKDPVQYVTCELEGSQYTEETTATEEWVYAPPECDVSLHRGWFWADDAEPKGLDHIAYLYMNSVGLGTNLLLNVPPAPTGQISPADVQRMNEFGVDVKHRFAATYAASATVTDGVVTAQLESEQSVTALELQEDLSRGQRIARHRVFHGDTLIAEGQTVGVRRIYPLDRTNIASLRIEIEGDEPLLRGVVLHSSDGHEVTPHLPEGYEAPTQTPDEIEAAKAAAELEAAQAAAQG